MNATRWQWYYDCRIRKETGLSTIDILSMVWRKVHLLASCNEIKYAVAFPSWNGMGRNVGEILRLWFYNEEWANKIHDGLTNDEKMPDYVILNRIKKICSDKMCFNYEAYFQHRLPGKINKNLRTIPLEVAIKKRELAMARRKAEQANLPHVMMWSSSGNKFQLVFSRKIVDGSYDGEPNGYGLSRKTQIVPIPIIYNEKDQK